MQKRILIIDDDNDILELLKIVFRDSGHDVIFSPVALDTNYISVFHPDLILLDIRINGSARKGAELCRELKSDPKTEKLPVILCSGEYNLREIARECNADMYLAKPYDMMSLLSQVNRYLS
jgi:two-component system response regulator VicR